MSDPFFRPLYLLSKQRLDSGSQLMLEYVTLPIRVWFEARESITTRYPDHVVYLPLIPTFLSTHDFLLSLGEPSDIFVRYTTAVITGTIFFNATSVLPHFARTPLLVLNLFYFGSFFFDAALVLPHPARAPFLVVFGPAFFTTFSLVLFLLPISEFVLCFALSVIRLLILFSKIAFESVLRSSLCVIRVLVPFLKIAFEFVRFVYHTARNPTSFSQTALKFVLRLCCPVVSAPTAFSKITFDMFTKMFPSFPVVVHLILLPRTTLSLIIILFLVYLVISAVVIAVVHLLWLMVTQPLVTPVHTGTSFVSSLYISLTHFT